ncbi:MAG TPA: amidohydrolase family protein [Clostridiales bacterium]|nr:amidohydrolase family protein [Clostridiales bacterium]
MAQLFEVKEIDVKFYEEQLKEFLPDQIIDIHTHVWLNKFRVKEEDACNMPVRSATWPSLVAKDNSVEDLIQTYKLMFPDKKVTPLIFGHPLIEYDIAKSNDYIEECSKRFGFPSLILSIPEWSGAELEEKIIRGGFLGSKVYLNYAKPYIPQNEIRIFDFLPEHQLDVLNKHGWIVMLHLPRNKRLKDPVNLAQLLEIEQNYPRLKLVVAHVGRTYCPEDVGDAFEVLTGTKNMVFDFSANTNQFVFERLIETVGASRILFGSDMPILRMRMRRICENGNYVNLVPKGLYGNISGDVHMREVDGADAEKLTYFMYEEIAAFKHAAASMELKKEDIENIFYNNAVSILGL